jgi:Protein of unknown function (DUF2637)
MSTWTQSIEFIGRVPTGVWIGLVVLSVLLCVVTWSAVGRRLRRAGERATTTADRRPATKDTALTVAAMIPAVLFWGMVLAGSLHGLVAFGRQVLGWHDGWEYLVPGTLDGVSVTFAFLAFRAIRKKKSPAHCQRVVWGAALASATVNFAYEYGHSHHNAVAGGYLGLLSLFGMVMFHEFLNQFEEGAGYVKRAAPAFGLRWITWPTNTLCAAIAWRNHPPAAGTPATVLRAVANLDRVRALKAATRQAKVQARHEEALAARVRRAELAMAASGSQGSRLALVPPLDQVEEIGEPAGESSDRAGVDLPTAEVRIPTTAATVRQWIDTWVRMCADGDLIRGSLNDELLARERYNVSAKQLRNIRNAATSGALRRRAEEVGINLTSTNWPNPAPLP